MARMFLGVKGIGKPDGSGGDSWVNFECGHCDRLVAGAVIGRKGDELGVTNWVECTGCGWGAIVIINPGTGVATSIPGARFGPPLLGVPSPVAEAYEEVRDCMTVRAYTAAEAVCRKILMHVAVEKGAAVGGNFAGYVTYLETNGYVTPPMKRWVDQIRKNGNEAMHDIPAPTRERAESTVMFTAELLRLVYEMAHMTANYAPPVTQT